MINIKTMKDLGDVQSENFAAANVAEAKVLDAIEQGKGGWGVRRDDAIILTLARDLKLSLSISERAEASQKELVGKRLELGRVKAAMVKLTAVYDGAMTLHASQQVQLTGLAEAAKAAEASARHHQGLADGLRVDVDRLTKRLTSQ